MQEVSFQVPAATGTPEGRTSHTTEFGKCGSIGPMNHAFSGNSTDNDHAKYPGGREVSGRGRGELQQPENDWILYAWANWQLTIQ